MVSLSSASLAASYGPPGSSTASMVSALAILIPVLAVTILVMASPQVRSQISRFRKDCKEYLYGPEKKKKVSSPSKTETVDKPASGTPEAPAASAGELMSFDHSIYDEEEPE